LLGKLFQNKQSISSCFQRASVYTVASVQSHGLNTDSAVLTQTYTFLKQGDTEKHHNIKKPSNWDVKT
jgi:hypothetical protein